MENCCEIYYFLENILNSNSFAIIIGGLLAGWFGFKQYKNQKVWETINKRYFEDGLENLITYLSTIRIIIEDNFSNALNNLRYLQKLEKKDFSIWLRGLKPEINKKVSASIPTSFSIVAGLFREKDFSKFCIKVFIDCSFINDFFVSEIPLLINKYLEDPTLNDSNKKILADDLAERMRKKYEETYKEKRLYALIENLEKILFRLRKLNIDSYEKLKNIKEDKEIKRILDNLINK